MEEFLMLIGQLFLITCIQSVLDMFIDKDARPYLSRILSIACYAGSLYILLKFVFDHLLKEMFTLFTNTFR